jgi:hypothetical protein
VPDGARRAPVARASGGADAARPIGGGPRVLQPVLPLPADAAADGGEGAEGAGEGLGGQGGARARVRLLPTLFCSSLTGLAG